METVKDRVRLAAVGDLHYSKSSVGSLQAVLGPLEGRADVLVLCGDLTDYGLVEEGRLLAKELAAVVKIPMVAVLGNHDFESGQQGELHRLLTDAGIHMLDGEACEIHGVGFAGVKGFGGGFDQRMLNPWGEQAMKQLVHEAIAETLKLESALARLRTKHRIAVLHYAPIAATVEGEPPEIYPFLGCSRLEEPLNRFAVTMAFHGHAHHGQLEGRTGGGVPVYNVSLSLLRRRFPDQPLFHLAELADGNPV